MASCRKTNFVCRLSVSWEYFSVIIRVYVLTKIEWRMLRWFGQKQICNSSVNRQCDLREGQRLMLCRCEQYSQMRRAVKNNYTIVKKKIAAANFCNVKSRYEQQNRSREFWWILVHSLEFPQLPYRIQCVRYTIDIKLIILCIISL